MGTPVWAVGNKVALASRVDGQGLSAGQPNIWGTSQLAAAFPATHLSDDRPGTVAKFSSVATRCIAVDLGSSQTVDFVHVANHNAPVDATVSIMSSATGAAGSWTVRAALTPTQLAQSDFAVSFTPAAARYWAIVMGAVGSLASPWYVGEFGLYERRPLTRDWGFGAAFGVQGNVVKVTTPYGYSPRKYLGKQRVYEGAIVAGQTDAEMDEIRELLTDTNHGATPFVWQNDADLPEAVLVTGENFEELLPRPIAVDTYEQFPIRMAEVPRGRNTI